MGRLWEIVSTVKNGRFDFVLDNAGFELYCDLVYADWLIQAGICKEIRFHGKRFAWFVSDVTKKDFEWLVNVMVYGTVFPLRVLAIPKIPVILCRPSIYGSHK